jgi:monoamine oxidase
VYRADSCICAIPARTLNQIRWDPPLREEHSQATDQLQYCRVMRTAAFYDERFWSKAKINGFSLFTSRVAHFCFESTRSQGGPGGILCGYATGDKADDLAAAKSQDLKAWITNDVLLAFLDESGAVLLVGEIAAPFCEKDEDIQEFTAYLRIPFPSGWRSDQDPARTCLQRL